MDEPFSNLDLKAKSSLRDIIKNIVDQTESSVIFVSHDPEEVMMLSDQILIIEAGKITQSGIPSSIYNFPNSISIAEMFSPILKFVISGETSYHRPESIKITKNDYFDLKGQVIGSDYLGKYQLLKVIVNDPIDQLIICPDYQNEYKINDLIKISLTNPLPTFIDE